MNRDEYLEMLATEPATPTQVGAIHGEFARLGVSARAERLAISAALLGLDDLGSTRDLVMGDAGRLVGMLRQTSARSELPDVEQLDGGQADEAEHRPTLAEVIAEAVAYLFGGHPKTKHAEGPLLTGGKFPTFARA